MAELYAGAAAVDITPATPMHLFGYPHVERISTGVHDSLFSSALYLESEDDALLFIANDIIFIPKDLAARARTRIQMETGLREEHILITATHTHSGPNTVRYASNEGDPTVPPPNRDYLHHLEDSIVDAAFRSIEQLHPAELAHCTADGSCVGTNRRSPEGRSRPEVPVLVVRNTMSREYIALMLVCSMHPTVLHEDSTLISADFPGMTREFLQKELVGADCPVLHHSGASGNQSPRHVVKACTFEEADRLGTALGQAVIQATGDLEYHNDLQLNVEHSTLILPLRDFPDVASAEKNCVQSKAIYQQRMDDKASAADIRTAECDVFGAEETVTLARMAASGQLANYAATCMPAEIQALCIGTQTFIGIPGELFVEFALHIESQYPDTHIITMANGELQGYLVTGEAVNEGGYEASNALFKSPDSGERIVEAVTTLLYKMNT